VRAPGAAVLAACSIVFGIAVADPGSSGSAAGPRESYCEAALAVAQYSGHDAEHLDTLVDRSLARAAPQVAGPLRVMRTASPRSAPFAAARARFTSYNTAHCCECHAAPAPPVLADRP
jgi:hypothetical protein